MGSPIKTKNKIKREKLMLKNVLFSEDQKGVRAGYSPNGREVYVDVYNMPNIAIIDNDENRLVATLSKFCNELLHVGGFSIVSFCKELMVEPNSEYREESNINLSSFLSELREEMERRYVLFSKCKAKNIDEYNSSQDDLLKRIVIFVNAQDCIRVAKNHPNIKSVFALCSAAGVFFCCYSNNELSNNKLYFCEESNYIEFEKIKHTFFEDALFYRILDFSLEVKSVNAQRICERFGIKIKDANYYVRIMRRLNIVSEDQYYRTIVDECSINREFDRIRSFLCQ